MSNNQLYNPLEIKEGLLPRFINCCKSKIKSIVTVGSLGLILTGIQTYRTISAPNIASEINEMINSTIHEYDAIEPVLIPDSLLKHNYEVRLLRSFQDEFEIYKLYLQALNTKEVCEENDIIKFHLYQCRYRTMLAYGTESSKIIEKALKVFMYEKDSVKNESFGKTINVDLMYSIFEIQKESNREKQKVFNDLTKYTDRGWHKLAPKEKSYVFEIIEKGYASEYSLKTIELQNEFYKSLYIAASIRLREIIRESM